MSLTSLLLINATVVAGWLFLFWLFSIHLRNVAIVDIAWGLGFVLVAITSSLVTTGDGINRWLLPVLVGLWGFRLSTYLAWRNHGKPEDKRYRAMRDYRGLSFVYSSLWIVFGLQAVILWIISLPVQLGIHTAVNDWHSLHFIGIIIWLIGFLFETVSDYQLARFLGNPSSKGQVMNRGLWRYTRHPNYFGDFLIWWGLFLIAVAGTWSGTWWTMIGPLLMSYLLMRVSGVPMLEEILKTTKPDYADYVQRTNGFFPWWPKSK